MQKSEFQVFWPGSVTHCQDLPKCLSSLLFEKLSLMMVVKFEPKTELGVQNVLSLHSLRKNRCSLVSWSRSSNQTAAVWIPAIVSKKSKIDLNCSNLYES